MDFQRCLEIREPRTILNPNLPALRRRPVPHPNTALTTQIQVPAFWVNSTTLQTAAGAMNLRDSQIVDQAP